VSPYAILVVVAVGLALAVGIPLAVDRASVARARASTDREWLKLCRFTLKNGTTDDLKVVAEATRPRGHRPWNIQVNGLPWQGLNDRNADQRRLEPNTDDTGFPSSEPPPKSVPAPTKPDR
jgi:hypothetical protein